MARVRKDQYGEWGRLGLDGSVTADGRLFVPARGAFDVVDLSGVLICHAGVDTVRALYRGRLYERWRVLFDEAETGCVFSVAGVEFYFSRMGKASGYRYSLKAGDLGVQLLVGSYFSKLDVSGNHLKIELSPHYLMDRGVSQIQSMLDSVAAVLLGDFMPSGCAVHLAVDVQGWEPVDVGRRLVTRAKRSYQAEGISEVVFDLAEASACYGAGETFMLGAANSVQLCLYDKTKQIRKIDKVDFWNSWWDAYTFGQYRSDLPVRRLEMRFHHSVVNELAFSRGEKWSTFEAVSAHLTDLWRYALNVHRLHYGVVHGADVSPQAQSIDPVWQLLRDDIVFFHPATGEKLCRKKETSTAAIEKNIQGLVGNLLTLAVRRGVGGPDRVVAQRFVWVLRRLDCWHQIAAYFSARGMNAGALQDWVEDKVKERRLRGRAA